LRFGFFLDGNFVFVSPKILIEPRDNFWRCHVRKQKVVGIVTHDGHDNCFAIKTALRDDVMVVGMSIEMAFLFLFLIPPLFY